MKELIEPLEDLITSDVTLEFSDKDAEVIRFSYGPIIKGSDIKAFQIAPSQGNLKIDYHPGKTFGGPFVTQITPYDELGFDLIELANKKKDKYAVYREGSNLPKHIGFQNFPKKDYDTRMKELIGNKS